MAESRVPWAIALHGGLIKSTDSLDERQRREYETALKACLSLGVEAMEGRSAAFQALETLPSALDVAELMVRALEDVPLFNAGRGSALTVHGGVEMEAAIMDGATGDFGAVAGVTTVRNPVSLARIVPTKTPHSFLSGRGVERFADEKGLEKKPNAWFVTEERKEELSQIQESLEASADTERTELRQTGDHEAANPAGGHSCHQPNGSNHLRPPLSTVPPPSTSAPFPSVASSPLPAGSVGCVVRDSFGRCAVAASSGGSPGKMSGRIGATPILGACIYASAQCAVAATGHGEALIRAMIPREVAALVEGDSGMPLQAAVDAVMARPGSGHSGLIAVSRSGEVALGSRGSGMLQAKMVEGGPWEFTLRS